MVVISRYGWVVAAGSKSYQKIAICIKSISIKHFKNPSLLLLLLNVQEEEEKQERVAQIKAHGIQPATYCIFCLFVFAQFICSTIIRWQFNRWQNSNMIMELNMCVFQVIIEIEKQNIIAPNYVYTQTADRPIQYVRSSDCMVRCRLLFLSRCYFRAANAIEHLASHYLISTMNYALWRGEARRTQPINLSTVKRCIPLQKPMFWIV